MLTKGTAVRVMRLIRGGDGFAGYELSGYPESFEIGKGAAA